MPSPFPQTTETANPDFLRMFPDSLSEIRFFSTDPLIIVGLSEACLSTNSSLNILKPYNPVKLLMATRRHHWSIDWSFLHHFYGTYIEKIFPKWRWHYSASRGTGQIQFWRTEVLTTSNFMIFGCLEPSGTLILDFGYTKLFLKIQDIPNHVKK